MCHARFEVPDPAPETVAAPEPTTWSMKTPEGRIYGPVRKSELDRWVSEGRVSNDCELRDGDSASWTAAESVYAVLAPGAGAAQRRGNPFAPAPFYSSNLTPPGDAVAVPAGPGEARQQYLAPHRGGLVLALGILAFVVACPILSFIAWTMGTNDLREMREGRMDSTGMGMTQAGMVLGMLLSVATVIGIMGLVFYVLFQAAI